MPQWRHARRYLKVRIRFDRGKRTKDQRTVDERVQDGHGTVRDTGIWVDLLQNYTRRVSNDRPLEMRPRNKTATSGQNDSKRWWY